MLLTVTTLRLPLAFTVVLGPGRWILLGTSQASTGLLKTGGVVVLIFAAVGAYIFAGSAARATGGPAPELARLAQRPSAQRQASASSFRIWPLFRDGYGPRG